MVARTTDQTIAPALTSPAPAPPSQAELEPEAKAEAPPTATKEEQIAEVEMSLRKAIPLVELLYALLRCAPPPGDGGLLALKGCRADTLPDHLQSIHAAIDTLRARAEALPELGSAALGGFLEPPPLQPLDHTSISQMRKDLEAAHQKQLHAKGDHSP